MSYYRETRSRQTGTTVITGHAVELGLDPGLSDYDGIEHTRWYNVCEEHGFLVGHQTLALARSFASVPNEWCEACQEITRGTPPA